MDVSVDIEGYGKDEEYLNTESEYRALALVRYVFALLGKLRRGEPVLSPVHRQVVVGVVVAGVGCVLGVVLAYPNLALDAWMVQGDVTLSLTQAQWFGSVVYLSSIPGSCVGGVLMQALGPRRLLLLLLPALALSWLPLTLATHNASALLTLRAIQGVLVSSCGLGVYVYPCEVVEAERRGLIGSLPDACFSLGFLLAHLLASLFHWSTVLLIIPVCFIFPAVLIIYAVPESPVWLIHKGKVREANDVLRNIRSSDSNVEKEILSIQLCGSSELKPTPLSSLLKQIHIFLPILVVLVLVLLKESTGQIMVVVTAVRIFREVDMGLSPLWTSVLVSCARFGANLIALIFLTRFPRRYVIIISSFTAGIAMLILANYFYATESGELWPKWIPFVSLLMFVVAYGGGIGPPVSLLITELLPGAVRGLGSGISNALLCSIQFGLTYMASREDFRFNVCFWGYAAGCLILAIFTLSLPETQNRKLEDLEQFWRDVKLNLTCLKWSSLNAKSITSFQEDSNDRNNNDTDRQTFNINV